LVLLLVVAKHPLEIVQLVMYLVTLVLLAIVLTLDFHLVLLLVVITHLSKIIQLDLGVQILDLEAIIWDLEIL